MSFTSQYFLFAFLPATIIVVTLARRQFGSRGAQVALTLASLVFYGSWGWSLLPVLLLSAGFNFHVSRAIQGAGARRRDRILVAGIAVNLAALAVFKYSNFVISNLNALTGLAVPSVSIPYPLGISFYTFQQVFYLVHVSNQGGQSSQGEDRPTFVDYLVYVSCFAYVTAGPILGPRDLPPQRQQVGSTTIERFVVALATFSIGLFKKAIIAGAFAPHANKVFDGAQTGVPASMIDAWLGGWSYFLQLYFDFSGYSDMALGIALMLGLRIPLNFNSPLRSTSAIEYWQRWHITLTKFLTTCIFTPLSLGQARTVPGKAGQGYRFIRMYAVPVMVTFLLAGLWHGPSWTFVLYGLWWGFVLVINHGWRQAKRKPLPTVVCWGLTMSAALVAMIIFRSADVATAVSLLRSLGDSGRASLTSVLPVIEVSALLVCAVAGCLTLPNTAQIMRSWSISSDPAPRASTLITRWQWTLDSRGLLFVAAIIVSLMISGVSGDDFLYYKF